MNRNRYRVWVVLLCAAAMLVLQGCGGSGDDGVKNDLREQLDTATARVTELETLLGAETNPAASSARGMLATAQARVTALETLLGTETNPAASSVRGMLATAQARVTELETLIGDATNPAPTSLRGQLAAARASESTATRNAATERERADRAETDRDTARRQAGTLEANQRAANLLTVFQAISGSPLGTSPVVITVPSRSSRPTFKQGELRASSISASGLTGARLTRTRLGTEKTTDVYTDRELSRRLLEHYASTTTAGQITLPGTVLTAGTTNFVTQSQSTRPLSQRLSISDGLPRSLSNTDTGDNIGHDPAADMRIKATPSRASFNGNVHGVPGRFECTGGTGCVLTATGTYNTNAVATNRNGLNSVTLAVSGGTSPVIVFRPSSTTASIPLCANNVQCMVDDTEYMEFGWWRDEPVAASGDYAFEVFAKVTGGAATVPTTGTAEYNGTAVGMYVDEGAPGSTGGTTRQGEFTADVGLDVEFTGTDVGLSGTIDGFITRPTGGSVAPTTTGWTVKLVNAGTVAASATDGTATIELRGTATTGTWSHAFVKQHGTAAADAQPPAVTGTFNTKIEDVLHLVGAYGAELD